MSISRYDAAARWLAALLATAALASAANSATGPDDKQANADNYQQAVASPVRTDTDRDADVQRKPLEFLEFAQVRPGMRVLDVAAGGGYTTQLLALVVGNQGRVWAQGAKPQPVLEQRLSAHPQSNIVPVILPYQDPVPGDAPPLDLVTIVMNYHDIAYMPVDRAGMDRHLFDALKRGGHLVVLDHSAKPGSGTAVAKTLHRIDEKVVRDEFLQAGFRLEASGDFWKNPADPRERAFFDMKIPTDKFALRFVKP